MPPSASTARSAVASSGALSLLLSFPFAISHAKATSESSESANATSNHTPGVSANRNIIRRSSSGRKDVLTCSPARAAEPRGGLTIRHRWDCIRHYIVRLRFTVRWHRVPDHSLTRQGGKWVESVLHSSRGGVDGRDPAGPVRFDSTGNLYGSTNADGSHFGAHSFNASLARRRTPMRDQACRQRVPSLSLESCHLLSEIPGRIGPGEMRFSRRGRSG